MPNADLETRLQTRSHENLKCMYSECGEDTGKFKYFEYHIELDPNKPRVQAPHKVALSVEFGLKKE